ncbi:TlpA family protein disulfide reductase [Sphingobacterium multivorum]|uniref:TlpA family protein disulfide reductase n=1 Tax=Sphingobacterium multivorum TaxID=28454 RepID=UPI00191B6530|nr:TlpA disulfide reductase family protein [Sphingobacterium multivorum]QQT62624.1 TlpA family protein disulfide reductase [Sphingobacterium multivorum]
MRKKIRQGKTYFKGTSILLKKRCKISAQNLLKKADSSGSLRVLFDCPSTLRRTSVASSSGTLRLLFDCASGGSRSVLEALPKPSRRSAKPVSNMSRRSLEAEPEASRRAGEVSPSSDFCLPNFALASAFHAVGLEFSSGSHRATPIKTRCRLDENPMKCKNSAGIAQKMIEDFQKVGDFRLTYGVESERSVLMFFRSICKAFVFRANTLLGLISQVVQRALKCFLFVADDKRAYRMVLTCLFLCLVSMFSLSAQTPRKDSGADGLSSLVALKPGDKIPDAVWNQSLELNYFNGKKKTIKFADLKGKLILLDFWATWCPSCIEGFPHLEDVLAINKDEIAVLLVNSTQTKDTQKRVQDLKKKYQAAYGFQTSLPYLFGDTIFQQLFPHNAVPHVVWINKDGILVANTYPNALSKENITAVLHTGNADFHQKKMRANKEVALITNEMLNNGFYAGSVFQTYQEGLDASSGNYSFDGKRTRYQLLNLRFSQLVALAFQKELKGIPWRHWQFAASSGVNSKQRLLTPNRYENSFCYEMVVQDSLPKSRARHFFAEDFKKFFGIKLSVENKPTDVWRVSFNSAAEKIRSKGGIPEVFLGDSQTEMKFRNIPLELLVDNLSLFFHRPLVIGASKEVLVDMTIPKDFEGWEEDNRKAFLRAMGLELNSSRETIACASFSLTDR